MNFAILVLPHRAQAIRKQLEKCDLLDRRRKLQKFSGKDEVAIPVKTSDIRILAKHIGQTEHNILLLEIDLPLSKAEMIETPAEKLKKAVNHLLKENGFNDDDIEKLMHEVPDHWEKHGDLILLPCNAFHSASWRCLSASVWQTVGCALKCNRVARQATVSTDCFRSPQVELLLGDNGIVLHKDNGISYTYDITKCMFSSGNITEKLRIAAFDCRGETVVDLYAGIGYFTLPYLVHAGAKHVHACEWNPYALESLVQNLELNGVKEKCTIHAGDNRQLQLRGIADRVNLGLIPSSEDGWIIACQLIQLAGGIMHIHGNVNNLTGICERLQKGKCAEHNSHILCSTMDEVSLTQQCTGQNNSSSCGRQFDFKVQNCQPVHSLYMFENKSDDRSSCSGADNSFQDSSGLVAILPHDNDLQRPAEKSLHSLAMIPENKLSYPSVMSDGRNHKDDTKRTWQSCQTKPSWSRWGQYVCKTVQDLLQKEHGGLWSATVLHIQHIKSYAPHIDHLVLDVRCCPQVSQSVPGT